MSQNDTFFEVRWSGKALEEMRSVFAEIGVDMPPDEAILRMKVTPCKFCGEMPKNMELAACDPIGVTYGGELIGETVCGDCMKKGL